MIRRLAYLSVLASLIGASVLSIDLRVFQLSAFRIFILLITILSIILTFQSGGHIKLAKNKNNGYSIKFMIIWWFYSILTIGWVQNYGNWFRTVYFISIGVISVIIYTKYFNTSENILKAFKSMSIMVILHNLIGWYEILFGNYLFAVDDRITKYSYYNYPVSMFNNTNNFALFMLFSVFISYVCMRNSKTKIMKSVYFAAILSSAYMILSTNSRASLLGLIISLMVFVYLSIAQKKWRYPILIFLFMSLIIILLLPSVFDNILYMFNKYMVFNSSVEQGSDFVRLNLIKNGFLFLFNTFGFGTGAGNIEHWMENYAVYNTLGVVNMHNWWMEILVSFGILIFTLYMIFYIKLFKDMLKKYKSTNNIVDKSISISIISCMSGYIIASISSSSNIGAEWLWVFWAVAIAYQGLNTENVLYTKG